jgi:hypothetical protein
MVGADSGDDPLVYLLPENLSTIATARIQGCLPLSVIGNLSRRLVKIFAYPDDHGMNIT